MALTIEIPEEVVRLLAPRAAREGMSLEAVAVDILRGAVVKDPKTMSPVEIVEYWRREGVIGSRPDIEDSAAYAREIREKAQRRER